MRDWAVGGGKGPGVEVLEQSLDVSSGKGMAEHMLGWYQEWECLDGLRTGPGHLGGKNGPIKGEEAFEDGVCVWRGLRHRGSRDEGPPTNKGL